MDRVIHDEILDFLLNVFANGPTHVAPTVAAQASDHGSYVSVGASSHLAANSGGLPLNVKPSPSATSASQTGTVLEVLLQ